MSFVKFGKFFFSYWFTFRLLFILDNSYWFYWFDFKLSLSCVVSILLAPVLASDFSISIIVFFRKALKFPFILLYTFYFFASVFYPFISKVFTLPPSLEHFLNCCFKIFANSNIWVIAVLVSVGWVSPCKLRFSWFFMDILNLTLWGSGLVDICFSRQSTWLCSERGFWPAFCALWFQRQFAFQSFCCALQMCPACATQWPVRA